ncbi:MAG: PBP1A family penicillin-binding protein [Deltaproteobacteria bacterium]|nr:PBP1A family penicillin-binding protein [Deltaproteobacteria bacterium]
MELKRRSKKAFIKRLLVIATVGLVIVSVGLALYMWYLATIIDKRFSARRWSIPSRVYSDSMLLYPGQTINPTLFYEKLHHLEYRDVSKKPELKGEMQSKDSVLDMYLHDLTTPSKEREGFPVRIAFLDNRIVSIERLDTHQLMPILEIEPEEIMLFFGRERERRRLVSIKQIPVYLTYAILAAEDSRFYLHHGVDPRGILRALYTNIRHGEVRQGGSTLTQQLAKNYFLTPERTLRRKFKEFLIAISMELMYDKNEIFEIYLNEIYFGQKGSIAVHGIGEASYFYFGKPVQRLSLAEAAAIAGLIKGPNQYSPYVNPERCRQRRNAVLEEIYKKGWITKEERDVTVASPVIPAGYTAYGKKAPYFIDYLAGQLPIFYSPEDLASLGLSIYTTLDTQVQQAAERALERGLTRLEKANPDLMRSDPGRKLQGAIIIMQPKTGYILAMAGGRDYSISQFNRIVQARRQPGSAFKPFVYLTGLSEFTPSSLLSNEPKTYEVNDKEWQPQNTNPVAEHGLRFRTALAKSDNLATVDLAMKVGLKRIVNTALTFRFSTPMDPRPSLALGAFEVIPLELARAYCTFAADGVLPNPLSMKAVVDEKGKILEQQHLKIESIISPEKAYIMNSLLRSVVTDGTARSLAWRGITFPAAGKTGTTNDYRDAWFVGYTPDILALVWVGFDNADSVGAEGSVAALPIWAELMKALPQYTSGSWFRKPPGVVTQVVCSQSGERAVTNRCPEPIEEIFLEKNVPTAYCPLHR